MLKIKPKGISVLKPLLHYIKTNPDWHLTQSTKQKKTHALVRRGFFLLKQASGDGLHHMACVDHRLVNQQLRFTAGGGVVHRIGVLAFGHCSARVGPLMGSQLH